MMLIFATVMSIQVGKQLAGVHLPHGGRCADHVVLTHVVLVHQADELVRILGIGGVTGFVNFARELVGVIGVFEGVLIARFLQEGRVILD